jgi:Flp pilus assembly protein TadD
MLVRSPEVRYKTVLTMRSEPRSSSEARAEPVRRWSRHGPLLLLVALTLAAHANTLANGFVWDDDAIIVKNPLTRDLSSLGTVLLSPDETPPYYRPLNRASYLFDHLLFGMDPRGFHAVNVVLQLGCVLALYAVARRLFDRRFPAFVAGALLAVHPLGVEVVAFVSARNNLFALLFALVSFALLIDAVREDRWARSWLSGAAFLLAMLSKEPGAMLLPVLVGWTVLQRKYGARIAPKLRFLAPHVLAVAIYAVLRTIALGGPVAASSSGSGATPSLLERLAVNAYTIPRYLGIVLFPKDLAIYRTLPEGSIWSAPWLVPAWIALGAIVALLLWRRAVPSSTGLLWLGVNLIPIAGAVAIPTTTVIAERFFFIPAVGLWLVAADAVERLRRRKGHDGMLAAGIAIVLLSLGARTIVRNRDWRDDLTLARSAVQVEPRSAGARYNLGLALSERGNDAGARSAWEETLRIEPGHALALVGLGVGAARTGDPGAAERYLVQAVQSKPTLAEAHLQLGKLYDQRGDLARAQREWEAILAREPAHAQALTELGTLHAARGDLAGAERYYRTALRSDPDVAEALFNLGRICETTGRPSEAIALYGSFVQLANVDPGTSRLAEERIRLLGGSR